jgi:hypothetical protein
VHCSLATEPIILVVIGWMLAQIRIRTNLVDAPVFRIDATATHANWNLVLTTACELRIMVLEWPTSSFLRLVGEYVHLVGLVHVGVFGVEVSII